MSVKKIKTCSCLCGISILVGSILVNYCSMTNYPKIYRLETTNIYYLIVSVGHEYRSGLAGLFWLRISDEVVVDMLAGTMGI